MRTRNTNYLKKYNSDTLSTSKRKYISKKILRKTDEI